MADAAEMIGTLGELAAMPGMPSEPTLRKIINEHDDFPVIERGKSGVEYRIPLERGAQWIIDQRQREAEEAKARQEQIRQLGFDLLGGDTVAPQGEGLTAAERRAMIEEEIAATKLAAQRGQLVRRAEVEVAVGEFVALVADKADSLPQRLVRRCGTVPREVLAALEEILRADRIAVSERMNEIAEADHVFEPEADAAADTAV